MNQVTIPNIQEVKLSDHSCEQLLKMAIEKMDKLMIVLITGKNREKVNSIRYKAHVGFKILDKH